jgi:hypothetical protein
MAAVTCTRRLCLSQAAHGRRSRLLFFGPKHLASRFERLHAHDHKDGLPSARYCRCHCFSINDSVLRIHVQVWLFLDLDHRSGALQHPSFDAASLSVVQLWRHRLLSPIRRLHYRSSAGGNSRPSVYWQASPLRHSDNPRIASRGTANGSCYPGAG